MAGPTDILTAIQNGVVALNNLGSQVKGSFLNISSQLTTLQTGPLTPGNVAIETDQEAATSISLAVTPGRQQFHPSAAKAWVKFAGSASSGAQAINASYNVSGVSRSSIAGIYTVSFSTPFSTANYAALVSGLSASVVTGQINTENSSSIVVVFISAGSGFDPTSGMVACFGDQ